jgi:hypothetical protein
MNKIENIFEKTKGYKTWISGGLILILNGIKCFWPDAINNDIYQWLQNLLLFVGGVGVGDKVRRNITIKK